jgi:hypothetical protein
MQRVCQRDTDARDLFLGNPWPHDCGWSQGAKIYRIAKTSEEHPNLEISRTIGIIFCIVLKVSADLSAITEPQLQELADQALGRP